MRQPVLPPCSECRPGLRLVTRKPVGHADALKALHKPRRTTRRLSSLTGETVRVEWRDPEDGMRSKRADRAENVPFESALPVRGMPAFKGQWSKPGRYWFSGCGAHVQYESRFEMDHLTLLDFDPRVVAVSSQPFRIYFGRSTSPVTHVPDLFVRYTDGSARLIDVKGALAAAKPHNALVFSLTEQVCDLLGVEYRVATEIEPTLIANVRWLAGYRRPQAGTDDVADHLRAAVSPGAPLGQAVAAAAATSGLHPAVVRPALFHLMWHQVVTADLSCLLDESTELSVGDRDAVAKGKAA